MPPISLANLFLQLVSRINDPKLNEQTMLLQGMTTGLKNKFSRFFINAFREALSEALEAQLQKMVFDSMCAHMRENCGAQKGEKVLYTYARATFDNNESQRLRYLQNRVQDRNKISRDGTAVILFRETSLTGTPYLGISKAELLERLTADKDPATKDRMSKYIEELFSNTSGDDGADDAVVFESIPGSCLFIPSKYELGYAAGFMPTAKLFGGSSPIIYLSNNGAPPSLKPNSPPLQEQATVAAPQSFLYK